MLRRIHAEFIKLRYLPIVWLIGGTVFSILVLVFFLHYNDVESISAIGKNPWNKLWIATAGIFSIFMNVPFVILLISASVFIENSNSTWKKLYATPNSRMQILLSKLTAILLVIILTYFLLFSLTLCSAFILNLMLPELEISYYAIQPGLFFNIIALTFINSLGFIGIQFFLTLRLKNFLAPAALGIVAFIIALIIGVSNTPVSHYFPYTYTLIGQDFEMFTIDQIGIVDFSIFNSVQLTSIVVFLMFISLSLFYEAKSSI